MRVYKLILAATVIFYSAAAHAQSVDKARLAADIEEILNACDRTSPSFDFERIYFDDEYNLIVQYPRQSGPIQLPTMKTQVPMAEVSTEYNGYLRFTCRRPACIKQLSFPTPMDHNGRVEARTRLNFSDCDIESARDATPKLQRLSELLSGRGRTSPDDVYLGR